MFEQFRPSTRGFRQRHLITGGLGGFGLALAVRLAEDGAAAVLLVGRSGVTNAFQRSMLRRIEACGCTATVVRSDIRTLELPDGPPPDRIWHAATVYRDALFAELTAEQWDAVVGTKVDGYRCLRRLWPDTPIVALSSVVATFGNAGQVHYGFANAWLDHAARTDPNTLAVRLGALDNVGYVTSSADRRALLDRMPFELLRVDDVLDAITQLTASVRNGVRSLYARKARRAKRGHGNYVLDTAQRFLAKVLGGSPDNYGPELALATIGLDSLSTMEVVHHLNDHDGSSRFNPSMLQAPGVTVQAMVQWLNCSSRQSDSFIASHSIVEKRTDVTDRMRK